MQKSYSPFGEQLTEAVSGFGYNGEYYNAQTGQIYLRARFYEPEQNRFSQKDILHGEITSPGSLNRYAYVQNDPVNFCDPSGMYLAKGTDGSGLSGGMSSTKGTKRTTTTTAPNMPPSKASTAKTPTAGNASTNAFYAQAADLAATAGAPPKTSKRSQATTSAQTAEQLMQQEYAAQRRAATTPTQQEYTQLINSGYKMTYGQYVSYKTQTRFPSYAEYINNKARGITTYQTYGPLQAMTNQYSTVYPRSPGYIPGMPTIERVSIESGDCSEPPEDTSSAKITSISQFVKGLLGSILEDQGVERALESLSNIITKFNPLLDKGAQLAIGPNIVSDLDPSVIAKVTNGVSWLKDKSSYIGGAIDFITQIYTGEDLGHAAIKTGAHVAIGIGTSAILAAAATAFGIPTIAVTVIGAVATYVAVEGFDKLYDNYIRGPLNNLWSGIKGLIGKD